MHVEPSRIHLHSQSTQWITFFCTVNFLHFPAWWKSSSGLKFKFLHSFKKFKLINFPIEFSLSRQGRQIDRPAAFFSRFYTLALISCMFVIVGIILHKHIPHSTTYIHYAWTVEAYNEEKHTSNGPKTAAEGKFYLLQLQQIIYNPHWLLRLSSS